MNMKRWLNIAAIVAVLSTAVTTVATQTQADGGETPAITATAEDTGPAGSPPLISSITGGETWFAVLATLLMAIVSPLTTAGLKRLGVVDPKVAAAANIAVGVAYYLLAWLVLHEQYPTLPQDPLVWIGLGIAGSGLGQATRSTWNNRGPAPDRPLEGR